MHPIILRAGVALLSLGLAETVVADPLTPREPARKESLGQLAAKPATGRVIVKFREGLKVRLKGGELTGLGRAEKTAFDAALLDTGAATAKIRRLHARDEAELDVERAEGEAESGEQLADLNNYYVIRLPSGVDGAAVADRLNRLDVVEYASLAPTPPPLPVDISPTTPGYGKQQGYRKTGKTGVGALDPKVFKGGNGAGIRVVDIEYEWQLDHEDLEIPADRMLTGGETQDRPFNNTDHGTAVLGEIVGKDNKYGVTGITPGVVAFVSPASTVESGFTPARAIAVAGAQLRKGDVMILEMQYWACGMPTSGDGYGPIEELQDVFDAIKAQTSRGVIVTSAAGNGGLDLDDPSCGGKFNRKRRNSGAIIVGAGSSANRSKLGFSSYGSRVDVQGWGENVVTTGYGDLFGPFDLRQRYTNRFGGTSSATPIVTGAVIAIQGVRKACGLDPLKPKQMRDVLIETGRKQGTGSFPGKIGPLPQILAALKATNAKSCVEKAEKRAARLATASAD